MDTHYSLLESLNTMLQESDSKSTKHVIIQYNSTNTVQQYSIVGTTMGGGHGTQRNQPKPIFRNHSLPLISIGQAKPKCVFRKIQNATDKFL